jgi:alkaline phosphatase D
VSSQTWNRRQLLGTAAAAAVGAATSGVVGAGRAGATPTLVRSGRPVLTHGVQSGDAVGSTANLWTRADRAGRMLVELSERPDFGRTRHVVGPVLGPDTDFTGRVRLHGLDAGERSFYRVRVVGEHGLTSEPLTGSLSIPGRGDGIRFVWTGDIAGQVWGINPDIGGMRIFESMRRLAPDFYLCSGDTVYADGPIPASVTLPDGRVWHNVTAPEKSKVAETLAEYRGQYKYNLIDANVRRFFAEVPQVNQWDDHEVRNNWYPGQILDDARYTEKRVDVLAARARRAFSEYVPISPGPVYRSLSYGPLLDVLMLDMRTYKDPNGANTYADSTRACSARSSGGG